MLFNISGIYKLKDSIEVFSSQENEKNLIQFYRINTRESIYIKSDDQILFFLSLMDGKRTLKDIVNEYNFELESVTRFIDFLLKNGIIKEIKLSEFNYVDERYKRQVAYFDDLLGVSDDEDIQQKIKHKKVVIFGLGSVGSAIAILLARMGVGYFVFIDYKRVKTSHFIKHIYCNNANLGKFKTDALKDYLLEINSSINIEVFHEKILPQTDLAKFISKNSDLIINTADEPYIGHISMKIGRYAWDINIPFYVGGGFDAHSMSTGEMIIPNVTPCIDCYVESFKIALKDYHPTYIKNFSPKSKDNKNIILGGPGSIAACSLFSASFGVLRIIYYFLGLQCDVTNRGEYLIDKGVIKYTTLEHVRRKNCEICKQ
ncbi:ThiF family adenylyltransferase [Campylobacter sp. CNRCH_2016_0050h]|uniref:ThiF family adenylyltransferase n=1 Tax=Campylobacter sp. CNRCH_2016_0050h TaxID=2911608 RepID=UPI0021E64F93|nr:ThiF family adenylyltransferase [Campylobacter sp. CNRCH_2016_0050h]MCV3457101.1 ThiF family adenylyltransferase [Campylobacter sp. CNRCH_2016_0050h]